MYSSSSSSSSSTKRKPVEKEAIPIKRVKPTKTMFKTGITTYKVEAEDLIEASNDDSIMRELTTHLWINMKTPTFPDTFYVVLDLNGDERADEIYMWFFDSLEDTLQIPLPTRMLNEPDAPNATAEEHRPFLIINANVTSVSIIIALIRLVGKDVASSSKPAESQNCYICPILKDQVASLKKSLEQAEKSVDAIHKLVVKL